ncbi:MAG: 16S rRNA (cytosine(967)-C(5))-methyltransferase RsmB [Acholeplasmataceae bacterium]|jgi:16S rRNA (cytosine967-C5)-methyltransferase|nr:16S rRNA (cytosine(967)-C(5))-methyltransferase RsmB [Acholeplasmataceae bacterium]
MNARVLALLALDKILLKQAYSNIALNDVLNKYPLSEEDASFCTKLVYGTVQNLIYLDYQLKPYLRKGKQEPLIMNLLRIALYQMLFLNVPDYAAINEAVRRAKKKSPALGGFVNAVLREIQRNGKRSLAGLSPVERLSVEYSYPEWLVKRYVGEYGIEGAEAIFASERNDRPLYIRINRLRGTETEALSALEREGISVTETVLPLAYEVAGAVQKTEAFRDGRITIQDLSAQYAARMLSPKKGEKVIDLCAAPGGKAAQLADLMENEGKIIACDIHPHRLELMEKSFRRLGVKNATTLLLDARESNRNFPKASFDSVLADVPCSGLGVVARRPEIKYNLSEVKLRELVSLQGEIMDSAWALLKPGGFFLYSTCTLDWDENEAQIKAFLERHGDAEIVEEKKILPQQYNSDGFYLCKLRRLI